MTQAPDTLTNIALSFARELAAREERLAEAQRASQREVLKIIEQGFSKISSELAEMRADISEMRADISEMRADISESKSSVRELLQAMGNLQGQLMNMQRSGKD
jgi:septal ring factor EnvC (AmiA/AmiB activator)